MRVIDINGITRRDRESAHNTVTCLRTCRIVSQKQERKRIEAFVNQINPLNCAEFSANVISKGTPCVRICASRDCDGIMHARARACRRIVVIIYRATEIHTRIAGARGAPRARARAFFLRSVTCFFGKTDLARSKSIPVPRGRANRASRDKRKNELHARWQTNTAEFYISTHPYLHS